MSGFLCNWNKRCPQCGEKIKYITTKEVAPHSDADYYICSKCGKKIICQIWNDRRYSITVEDDLPKGKTRFIIHFEKAITPYILEQLEDKIAALLESEGEKGYIHDLSTSNITNFPLSDEHEYSEEIQELRNWKKYLFAFPKHLAVKYPVFWAKNGEHLTIWFELRSGEIGYFDYLPNNRPPFMLGKFESKEIALKRAQEMVDNESWEIIETQWMLKKE